MSEAYLKTVENRRTVYPLNKNLPAGLTNSKIEEIVRRVVLHTPSAFNTQTARLVVVTGPQHDAFWDLAAAALQKQAESQPDWGTDAAKAAAERTQKRLPSFRAGYGTILFFDRPDHLVTFGKKYGLSDAAVSDWLNHSNAMHQIHLWTTLEAEGAGANLQHYPVPISALPKEWKIEEGWPLRAQLVFGGRESPENGPKEFLPVEGPESRVQFYHD